MTDEEPIAVIADHPNRENEARRIAAHLRRAGQITLPTFGGNARKQAKEAKKAGAVALLYVRDEEDIKSRLHLTELKHRDDVTRLQTGYSIFWGSFPPNTVNLG